MIKKNSFYSIILIQTALILFTSCDERSNFQIEESTELYKCMCDTLIISRRIEQFRENVNSYNAGMDAPEEMLLTNSCYLELVEKRNRYNEILKEKSIRLQKLNLGFISNKDKAVNNELGYIKGSDYEIHILKPAQRDLAKYCRDLNENALDDQCYLSSSPLRDNLWIKPRNNKHVTKPSSTFLTVGMGKNKNSKIRNKFFNWLNSINKDEKLTTINAVNNGNSKQFFTDLKEYLVFNNGLNTKLIWKDYIPKNNRNGLLFSLEIPNENIPVDISFFLNTLDRYCFTKDNEGNIYLGVSYFSSFYVYKIIESTNTYEKTFEYEPENLGENRFITTPRLFFQEDELFLLYNNTEPSLNGGDYRIEFLKLNKPKAKKIITTGIKADLIEGNINKLELIDIETIDEDNVLLSLLQNDNNTHLIMKYNINNSELELVNEWYFGDEKIKTQIKESNFDQSVKNTESNFISYWNIIEISETMYKVLYSIDNANSWSYFDIALPYLTPNENSN